MNLRQLESNFEALAAEDPLWTILSDDSKRGGKWDENAFYKTGESVIDDLEARLEKIGFPLEGYSAIDFGCGGGRLTFPLSKRFTNCYGVDISSNMVAYAKCRISRGPNCSFIVNRDTRLDFENESIDLAFSAIVFQHISPRYTLKYFRELSRVLKPKGLLVFQLPSRLNPQFEGNQKPFRQLRKQLHYRLKAIAQRIPFIESQSFFEMHAIPCERVIRHLETQCSFKVLGCQDFPAAGPAWISHLYIARKTSPVS
ncbi:MAG: class I SAM-dependent methyltransferase [Opitutales bacterium]